MPKTYRLKVEDNDPFKSISGFLAKLIESGVIDALLAPQSSPRNKSVVQTLVKDKDQVAGVNPWAPLLLMNSAALVSRLAGGNEVVKLAAVLRSCEIRAVIELAKLKQINMDSLIIIGVDCLGTYESATYQTLAKKFESSIDLTKKFILQSAKAQAELLEKEELRLACRGCEYPNPPNADIAINFLGLDINKEILINISDKLSAIKPEEFNLNLVEDDVSWREASKSAQEKRKKFRDELFKEVQGQMKDIKSFLAELEHCRRCYNCRRECPICYCKECIFDSLNFEHDQGQYLKWAKRKGKIKMPTDTLLFHLTRMNHMVISCVGCGQCTSACPNQVPIAKFFKTIGFKVQGLFDYQAGRSIDEENPQATFKEDEFPGFGHSEKKH